jgi:hypothetical protein
MIWARNGTASVYGGHRNCPALTEAGLAVRTEMDLHRWLG